MAQGWLQVAIFVGVVIALTPLLGKYMARVFSGERVFLSPVLGPVERFTYRVLRVDPSEEHDWKAYAKSLVLFSVFSWIALYLILRTQGIQPFNPEGFHSGPWDVSFNTASSFVSNTNWQYYGGETTLTYFAADGGADGARTSSPPPSASASCSPSSAASSGAPAPASATSGRT